MMLQLQGAWLGFAQPLLGPLDLCLPKAARWAITGPNGAGKSLLLKALAGQARLHRGVLRLAPQTHLRLLAQEHPRPHPWPLSGADWFRIAGSQPPDLAPLQTLLRQRLDRLSGGQWQLLRLAAILAPCPRHPPERQLILLDEPANHLDTEVRGQAIELIRALHPAASLLLTSHDDELLQATGVEIKPLRGFLADE
jgi:ATPase subunit of ABC transporter with duplicated ATPase domains